jgi:hypothetical protein
MFTERKSLCSNNEDFKVWANKNGWFKMRTAYCENLMIDYWLTTEGKAVWVQYNDDDLISKWLE